eukprot:4439808-Amphidinium_carterae.1
MTLARAVAMRRGVSRIRHLHTPLFWLHTRVYNKEIEVRKVADKLNVSDIATKSVDEATMKVRMAAGGFHEEAGQSSLALQTAV